MVVLQSTVQTLYCAIYYYLELTDILNVPQLKFLRAYGVTFFNIILFIFPNNITRFLLRTVTSGLFISCYCIPLDSPLRLLAFPFVFFSSSSVSFLVLILRLKYMV